MRPRIGDRHRKGQATIQVADGRGKPVAGAPLDIRQKTHEFLFGCNPVVLGRDRLGPDTLTLNPWKWG